MYRTNAKFKLLALMICVFAFAWASQALGKAGDEQALMQSIRQHIGQNMLWPSTNIRMEFPWGVPKLDDLAGKVTFSVESRSREECIGDTAFTVRIFAKGIFVREETVRVRIEVLRDFVVSSNTIAKDSILTNGDVTIQSKWVKSIPMQTVSALDDVLGKTIAVSVRPHTQITRTMLKDLKPVKKGKMVQVILDNGAMKMMMSGIAEEDGAEDSVVRIRNVSSNKIIYARVVGHGKVQVDF